MERQVRLREEPDSSADHRMYRVLLDGREIGCVMSGRYGTSARGSRRRYRGTIRWTGVVYADTDFHRPRGGFSTRREVVEAVVSAYDRRQRREES